MKNNLAILEKPCIMLTMKIKGETIRVLREAKGLSVTDLAKKCGVRRQAVEAWERGEVKKFDTLAKIATALEVKEVYLLEV